MYSRAWFDSFARTRTETATADDVAAIIRLAPPAAFPAVLDVGCGIGRVAVPLAAAGYRVTGIDRNPDLLVEARGAAPGLRLVALDQLHTGRLRWRFDLVLVLWHSLGYGAREDDLALLCGLRSVLHRGGRLLLDLYHPGWLARNPRHGPTPDGRTHVQRWLESGRCHHLIHYADGTIGRMAFNVYSPLEMRRLASGAGFRVTRQLVHWRATRRPGPAHARYQLVLQ